MAWERNTSRDINIGTGEPNAANTDGTTIWFGGNGHRQILPAFKVSDSTADPTKNLIRTDAWIDANSRFAPPYAGFSNGTILWWVAQRNATQWQCFAYNANDRSINTGRRFNTETNNFWVSATTDGNMLWAVANLSNVDQAHGFPLPSGTSLAVRRTQDQVPIFEAATAHSNTSITGMANDGTNLFFLNFRRKTILSLIHI